MTGDKILTDIVTVRGGARLLREGNGLVTRPAEEKFLQLSHRAGAKNKVIRRLGLGVGKRNGCKPQTGKVSGKLSCYG